MKRKKPSRDGRDRKEIINVELHYAQSPQREKLLLAQVLIINQSSLYPVQEGESNGGRGRRRKKILREESACSEEPSLLAVLIHPAISSCEGDAVGLCPQLKQIK